MDNITNVKNIVASNLKKYRTKRGLTQKELADEINKNFGTDIKHNTVSSWENSTNSVDTTMLKQICDILKIDLNAIYGIEPRPTTLAAHFDGEKLTPEEEEEINNFVKYVLSKRQNKD